MLEDKWKQLIKDTIRKYLPDESYKIFIFGSRAEKTNRKWSDVDVGIEGPKGIPWGIIENIKEELENSRIPYRVDVVDFKQASDSFRKVAGSKIFHL